MNSKSPRKHLRMHNDAEPVLKFQVIDFGIVVDFNVTQKGDLVGGLLFY